MDVKKNFFGGIGLGIGLLIALSAFMVVQAVAPGSIVGTPKFGPTDNDISAGFNIRCDWAGEQMKELGCDSGGGEEGCIGINVTCTDGVVTSLKAGRAFITTNSITCGTTCGTPW